MANEACLQQAIDLSKGSGLEEADVKRAYRQIDKIKAHLLATGRSGSDEEVSTMILRIATRNKFEALRKERTAAANLLAYRNLSVDIGTRMSLGQKAKKALKTTMYGTVKYIESGRKSWMTHQGALRDKYVGEFEAEIMRQKPHLTKLMWDKKFDEEVTRELAEFREGGQKGITKNTDALWLAEKMAVYYERSRGDLWGLGGDIEFRPGYQGVLMHDPVSLYRAGESRWVADVSNMIDKEASFPYALDDQEIKAKLSEIYTAIMEGDSRAKMTYLHFRDGNARVEYRNRYGSGSTIGGFLAHQQTMARVVAGYEWYGPNMRKTMERITEDMKDSLRGQRTGEPGEQSWFGRTFKPKGDLKLDREIADLDMKNFKGDISLITGDLFVPQNMRWAQIGANTRAVVGIARMGKGVLVAFNDLATSSHAVFRRGGGHFGLIRQLDGAIQHMTDPERRAFGASVTEGIDSHLGQIVHAAAGDDMQFGVVAKLGQWFYKWNGLAPWTDLNRGGSVQVISEELGRNSSKAWGELHPLQQWELRKQAIGPSLWEVARKASHIDEHNGRRYFYPESIQNLGDDLFHNIHDTPGRPHVPVDVAREKHDLEMAFRRYFWDQTNNHVVMNEPWVQKHLSGGARRGTPAAEAMRFITHLKGYPIAYTQRILGQALTYPPEYTRGQAAWHIAQSIVPLAVGMTISGYLSIVAAELAAGIWPPRNPLSLQTWQDGLIKGGALGLIGDMLFGQVNTYNHPAALGLMGPEAGTAFDAYGLWADFIHGNPKSGEALNLILSNTPFLNLFWAKYALEALIINNLRETVSPGFLARQESARRTKYQQDYVLPRRREDLFQ